MKTKLLVPMLAVLPTSFAAVANGVTMDDQPREIQDLIANNPNYQWSPILKVADSISQERHDEKRGFGPKNAPAVKYGTEYRYVKTSIKNGTEALLPYYAAIESAKACAEASDENKLDRCITFVTCRDLKSHSQLCRQTASGETDVLDAADLIVPTKKTTVVPGGSSR